jgi:hypothetical protein
MPYEILKNDRDEWCVFNKDTGDNKGCSDTQTDAVAHMRALYAAENKETEEIDTLVDDALKELEAKYMNEPVAYVDNYGATSYAELEDMKDAAETELEIQDAISNFPMLVRNIMWDSEIENKADAVNSVADELGKIISDNEKAREKEAEVDNDETEVDNEVSFIDQVKTYVKETFPFLFSEKKEDTGFMVWKESDDSWKWAARYSNNFRDRDTPPEIISGDSHRRFVELVDKGLAPYPELWLWHGKDWKIGEATWVAYDEVGEDVGFAVAAGHFMPGCEQVAEKLLEQKDVRVSHGMPIETIKRDDDDDTIIVEHETREISPLPAEVAANELTGFVTIKKEQAMAIPEEKRNVLINDWGMKPELLARLESMNSEDADEALGKGMEHKDTEDVPEEKQADEDVKEAEVKEEVADEVTEPEAESENLDLPPTRQEVADAVGAILQPFVERVDQLTGRMESLGKAVESVKGRQDDDLADTLKDIPAASLSTMLAERVIGNQKVEVKEEDDLNEKKPAEADTKGRTGIPFLDEILSDSPKQ